MTLLAAEVFLAVPLHKLFVSFDCWQNWGAAICGPLFASKVSIYTLVPCFVLLAMLLSPERKALTQDAALRPLPLGLNLAGLVVFLLPVLWLEDGTGTRFLWPSLIAWGAGMALAGLGACLMLAPSARWHVLLRQRGGVLALCLAAGLAAPFIAQNAQGLWRIQVLSDATFHCVVWLMQALGYEVTVNFPERSIGTEAFRAIIAPLCSGIEGIGLITFFVTLYLVLFRRELRFPAALWLYPLGIAASWLLNVVRIAVLIAIGLGGNPELAVNGFHSHAGWLMFTLLALAIVLLARSTGFFLAAPAQQRRPALPFLADPMVAQILPFALFMASALLASTFATMPALVYPLRALVMAGGLALFLPYLRQITWRLDPLALSLGLAVGLVWTVTAPQAAGGDLVLAQALAELSMPLLAVWIAARMLGTVVLVPVIEELFFRNYLLQRLAGKETWRIALALLVTSGLFAALHDRWALAFVAGLVYGGLRLRSGRIGDAILAHMASNAWIAAAAILANDWSLI
ncbi:exosortase E/protease, VPEID-CTERM system [Stagnihabitans tardus]|nr:exosortase E/protease, VPEID-CTERM system [Stagnihabitans tardus]